MCGICGMVRWDGQEVDAGLVAGMRDLMVSRGPDDAGLHIEPGVGLGHRRLSVIDLSAAGHQPMGNEDGSVWLVFNGEIYSYRELREELLAAGHRFRSQSDAEVLVHGYEQWGIDGLAARLLGMFALAIWDRPRRALHLLRDHVGKKPLFYRADRHGVVFASDIKCLWLASGKALPIDERGLDEFLYYYFITQNRSIYKGVEKLPPAHRATVTVDGLSRRRYWSPDYAHKEQRGADEWIEGIDHHVRQAVRRRLVADVPLGAFLSGGVDSSVVCATMAREAAAPPRTFTVGFRDSPDGDERRYARQVADHIGSDHTELVAEADVFRRLPQLVWHYGEPFGDSSAVPTYLIAEAARRHAVVVLAGDGGDEAFGGYDRYVTAARAQRLSWLPGALRQGLLPSLAGGVSGLLPTNLLAQRAKVAADYAAGRREALAGNLCWWDGLRGRLYNEAWQRRLGDWHPVAAQHDVLASLNGPTPVDRALQYVLEVRLPSDYLAKVDVATMAHALEVRCPFLDLDLLRFTATIPADVLIEGHLTKALLKRYARRLVPAEVIDRPKRGFSLPLGDWLRHRCRGLLEGMLLGPEARARGWFEPKTVRTVLAEHLEGRTDHTHRLWTLLIFEIWCRLFVDGTLQPGDPLPYPLDP